VLVTRLKDHPDWKNHELWREYAMAALAGVRSLEAKASAQEAARIADLMMEEDRARRPGAWP
jgi:hypothetical protein